MNFRPLGLKMRVCLWINPMKRSIIFTSNLVSLCKSGNERGGLSVRMCAGGFSGIAAIIWEDVCRRLTFCRSNVGRHLNVIKLKWSKIVLSGIYFVVPANARHCCNGLIIQFFRRKKVNLENRHKIIFWVVVVAVVLALVLFN